MAEQKQKNEPNPQFIQKRSNDDKVNYVNCPLVDLCKCGNAYFIHFSRITATTTTERNKKFTIFCVALFLTLQTVRYTRQQEGF